MNREIKYKKIIAATLTALLIFVESGGLLVAYEIPAPQAAPEVPTAPTPPAAPEESDIPTAPTPPAAPDPFADELIEEETSEENVSEESQDQGDNEASSQQSTDDIGQVNTQSGQDESGGTGSQSADGQNGDPSIETGDAAVSGIIANDVNNNEAGLGTVADGGSGATVINDGNGSDSDNSGSITIADDSLNIQDNSATILNSMDQDSNSGYNSTSKNVGSSEIDTGDANNSGTIVNTLNTNSDGIMVSEFNVVEDYVGDIVLDFAANCILGCGGNDLTAKNSGNGADSNNDANIDYLTNDLSFQTNDANVENNMVLDSNSGYNSADMNTGGDSTIDTGDANVAANVVNFANNNLAGNVVFGVVNIFGDLIGDILLPANICCTQDVTVQNTANGSSSTNNAGITTEIVDTSFQFNDAEINNIIFADANTGANDASKNTGGSSEIDTGDSSVDVGVLNIANTNVIGGDTWLVLVNEAGKWIGRVVGAGAELGSNLAGSLGWEFEQDENGELIAKNIGNASGSDNNANINSSVLNTTVQENNAVINNNLDLSANTGGNSASKNTGGNSSISTGDANIIANIVNFVNNNIQGSGRLFVTTVNVFGSWIGDFVASGYEKEEERMFVVQDSDTPSVGGSTDSSNDSGNSSGSMSSGVDDQEVIIPAVVVTSNEVTTYVAGSKHSGGSDEEYSNDSVAYSFSLTDAVAEPDEKSININLAWILVFLPFPLALYMIRKGKAYLLSL